VLLNNSSINYSFPELFVALHSDKFCVSFSCSVHAMNTVNAWCEWWDWLLH